MKRQQISILGIISEDRKFLYHPLKLNGRARMRKQCEINKRGALRAVLASRGGHPSEGWD
jgi:hypothetical protein